MTSSYSSALSEFFKLHSEAEHWQADEINITVATSLHDDTPQTINIAPTIGKNKNVPRASKRNDKNCYWLQKSFNLNNASFRQKYIHPMFVHACHASGFNIHGEYEPNDKCIQFGCLMRKWHDEVYQKEYRDSQPRNVKNPNEPPIPRTRRKFRPVKSNITDSFVEEDSEEEGGINKKICTFRFRVYWDDGKKRWFIPLKQRGCVHHCNHLQETPEFLRIQTRHVPSDEIQISNDALDSHISATATASLFKKRTGIFLDYKQLQYLKKRNKNDLVMEAGGSLEGGITAVDRLIASLQNDHTISFIVLYGDFNTTLLTIKTKSQHLNNSAVIGDFLDELGDDTDSPELFAKNCKSRSSLVHSKSGKIVLAVGWTNVEARRKFDMFPEFMGGDDTEGTNSEERPLYTLCGKDNMNTSYGHTWVFMPSKSTWVYSWIFRNALPVLHPGTALSRVQLFIMDACPQETRAAESVCGRGIVGMKTPPSQRKTLPNAHLRLCAWHKINRNFTNDPKYKSKISAARKSDVKTSVEIDVIIRWLWYFIKYYENEEEVNLAMRLLHYYLNEDEQTNKYGEIPGDLRMDIKEFITKGIQFNTRLFESSYTGLMTMSNCTSSVNESQHRVYHHHSQGPKSGHDLAESFERINHITSTNQTSKSRIVASNMRSDFGKAKDREEKDFRLTDYCNDQLLNEFNQNIKYCVHPVSETVFYVKRMYFEHPSTPDEELNLPHTICKILLDQMNEELQQNMSSKAKKELRESWEAKFSHGKKGLEQYKELLARIMRHVIPRFERTRTVKIVPGLNADEKIIICDCNMMIKWGLACRHIYRILKRHPTVKDAKVRWLVGYGYYYGRNDKLSKQLMMMRDECKVEGVPLSSTELTGITERFRQVENAFPLEYFERSLGNNLRLVGNDNYWVVNAKRICNHLGINSAVLGCQPCATNKLDEISTPIKSNLKGGPTNEQVQPIGAIQENNCKGSYKVPSQLSPQSDCDLFNYNGTDFEAGGNDMDCDTNAKFPSHNDDPYHNFMNMYKGCAGNEKSELFLPVYQTNTKLAKSLGPEGDRILNNGLKGLDESIKELMKERMSNMRQELMEAHSKKDNRHVGDMSSIPTLNNSNKKHKRKAKVTSPPISNKKRRSGNEKS